jgi:CheY-like chemotaxis protein
MKPLASTALPPRPVLYAEDDENDAFLMRHAFVRAGLRQPLVVVPDGQQAIDYLSGAGRFAGTAPKLPGLVVLDLNLPLRTGFEVLKWIRSQARFAKLPVAVLSSSNQRRDMEQAKTLGASAYFVKPADVQHRTLLVREFDERWFAEARDAREH